MKKVKKLVAFIMLFSYLTFIGAPYTALAETKIDKLYYTYYEHDMAGTEKELKYSTVVEEIEKYIEDSLKDEFSSIIAEDFTANKDIYKNALNAKYPEKVSQDANYFDEYRTEYLEDYLYPYFDKQLKENLKELVGKYELSKREGKYEFSLGPLANYIYNNITYDEYLAIYSYAEENFEEMKATYFPGFYNDFIKSSGVTIEKFEESTIDYTIEETYLIAYIYNNGEGVKKYTAEDLVKHYKQEALQTYIESSKLEADSNGQFDIHAITDDSQRIGTTFGDHGYLTSLEIDGIKSVIGSPKELADLESMKHVVITTSGINFDKANYAKLNIAAKNTDDSTVEVTYTLTNNQAKTISYKLASAADVEIAENDEAAVSKTKNGFIMTQDNQGGNAYGAQLQIINNEKPTTLYVGPWSSNAYRNEVFNESVINYFTADDGEDTVLAYSWQGTLEPGQTKTFTTTFTIGVASNINVNFYHQNEKGEYTTPSANSPVSALIGGTLYTENTLLESTKGSHIEWNTKKDGTGDSYPANSSIIAPDKDLDLYEMLIPNTVVNYKGLENGYYLQGTILNLEVLNTMLKEDLDNSYNNIEIILDIKDANVVTTNEEKDLINSALKDGEKVLSYFDADLYKLVYTSEDGSDVTKLTETEGKLKIQLSLPWEYLNHDNSITRKYQLIRIHDDKAESIDATLDEKTGKLVFETDKFSTYAISYIDEKKEEPIIPDTGDKIMYSFGFMALVVSSLGFAFYLNKRK